MATSTSFKGGSRRAGKEYRSGTLGRSITAMNLSVDNALVLLEAAGAGGGVPSARTLTGTTPITVGGDHNAHDLSANRTIAIPAATNAAPGHATALQIAALETATSDIGDLMTALGGPASSLTTTTKASYLAAINELVTRLTAAEVYIAAHP